MIIGVIDDWCQSIQRLLMKNGDDIKVWWHNNSVLQAEGFNYNLVKYGNLLPQYILKFDITS